MNNKIAETPATEVDAIAELEEKRTELEKQLNDFGKLKDNMDLRGEISNAIADKPMPEPKVEADGQMRLFNRGAEPYTEVDTEEQKLAAKAVERALDNLERQGIEVEKRVRQAEMWDRVGDDAEVSKINAGSVIRVAHGIHIPNTEEYYGLLSAIDTQANTYFHIDQEAEIAYRSIIPYGENV